jgi:SAM-dependent methyltransferase
MTNKLKHLDLGCGARPSNPYKADHLYGIDIEKIPTKVINENLELKQIKQANLVFEDIPFETNFFDSLSAFDFLEHIPRIISNEKNQTKYAFVELMNEVYRVLKEGGRFYALTPYYPNAAAFQDPTHVNIITNLTHKYFCEPNAMARMYGFKGKFKLIRAKPAKPSYEYEPIELNITQKLQALKDRLRKKQTHFIWEFEAIK